MLLNKSISALKNFLLVLKLVLGSSKSYIIACAYVMYIDVEIFPLSTSVNNENKNSLAKGIPYNRLLAPKIILTNYFWV